MAKIIAELSGKGGGGKSTSSIHLATALASMGHATVLIDVDPQASSADWADTADLGENLVVQSVVASRLGRTIEAAADADYVVIDTGAKSSEEAMSAARVADLILVPCRPSILDLRAIKTSVDVARIAGKLDRTYVFLNAVAAAGTVADEAEEAAGGYGVPVCPVRFGSRRTFQAAIVSGSHAMAYEPKGKAAAEQAALAEWVIKTIDEKGR
ncbi:hypothetical protein ASG43_21470 [Aureimonas sp. Leaf454]|uniref:AAA family ATPase n=1 Tax=Aureimonas sp. Leaf454 TaxID=1736381 RepID=UPI0006F47100|nr:AAA family ATPase [Aureimonas sp. Leaf454]KQT51177.1 hypothetical protein ASG43_21470 [Aureimonas sp. Leaf454]